MIHTYNTTLPVYVDRHSQSSDGSEKDGLVTSASFSLRRTPAKSLQVWSTSSTLKNYVNNSMRLHGFPSDFTIGQFFHLNIGSFDRLSQRSPVFLLHGRPCPAWPSAAALCCSVRQCTGRLLAAGRHGHLALRRLLPAALARDQCSTDGHPL
jgi:hypothetical protein